MRKALVGKACAPFENPAVRDALSEVKRETEQTIDEVTLDTVVGQGFDAAAKEKATEPAAIVPRLHRGEQG